MYDEKHWMKEAKRWWKLAMQSPCEELELYWLYHFKKKNFLGK